MKQEPCHCDAYSFPHRPGGGECPHHDPMPFHRDAGCDEERALFDRAEAQAINREREQFYAK